MPITIATKPIIVLKGKRTLSTLPPGNRVLASNKPQTTATIASVNTNPSFSQLTNNNFNLIKAFF